MEQTSRKSVFWAHFFQHTYLVIHGPSLTIHTDYESCLQMQRMGIFERYGVKVLGTSIKTLETSEDRDLLYVRPTLVQSYEEWGLGHFCGSNC